MSLDLISDVILIDGILRTLVFLVGKGMSGLPSNMKM